MDRRDIIAIGGSAGGLRALTRLFTGMPKDVPATVFVVLHIGPSAKSVLPHLLERAGWLPAFQPVDGEPVRPGHIHVAPPDHHLLVRDGRALVRRGPRENRTRPAIDPLFRSVAAAYGTRAVGVVLSGMLDDGTAGLHAIARCGGLTIVQEPADAEWAGMPSHAIAQHAIDHVLPVAAMPALLVRLIGEPAPPRPPVPVDIAVEARIAEKELATMADDTHEAGLPTTLSCPECGGGLTQIPDGPVLRFRCQIGHAFSPETMAEAQSEAMEAALWVALRTHEDRVELFQRLADHARTQGHDRVAAGWHTRMIEAQADAALLRRVLSGSGFKHTVPPKTEGKAPGR